MFKKIRTQLVVIFSVTLLSSCSFTFVYNHLDWWAGWYLDDYVSLDNDQQQAFDDAFERLHLWHRKTQLIAYKTQVEQLKDDVNNGINKEQLALHLTELKNHWQIFRAQLKPDLIALSQLLSAEQRQELDANIQQVNQERYQEYQDEFYNQDTFEQEKWQKERCKELQASLKKWFGKLTAAQKKQICQLTSSYIPSFNYWYQYRVNWQQAFSKLITPSTLQKNFELQFAELITNPEQFRDAQYQQVIDQNNQVFIDILSYAFANMTDKQQQKFDRRIDELIEDLEELAADD